MKTVTVGGHNIIQKIHERRDGLVYKPEPEQKISPNPFQPTPNASTDGLVYKPEPERKSSPTSPQLTPTIKKESTMEKVTNNSLSSTSPIKFEESLGITKPKPEPFSHQPIPIQKLEHITHRSNMTTQLSKLNTNNSSISKNHAAFLKTRQQFSKQMSEIIQLQIACAENLLKE
jgi:hypothetical protein